MIRYHSEIYVLDFLPVIVQQRNKYYNPNVWRAFILSYLYMY